MAWSDAARAAAAEARKRGYSNAQARRHFKRVTPSSMMTRMKTYTTSDGKKWWLMPQTGELLPKKGTK